MPEITVLIMKINIKHISNIKQVFLELWILETGKDLILI